MARTFAYNRSPPLSLCRGSASQVSITAQRSQNAWCKNINQHSWKQNVYLASAGRIWPSILTPNLCPKNLQKRKLNITVKWWKSPDKDRDVTHIRSSHEATTASMWDSSSPSLRSDHINDWIFCPTSERSRRHRAEKNSETVFIKASRWQTQPETSHLISFSDIRECGLERNECKKNHLFTSLLFSRLLLMHAINTKSLNRQK